MNAIFRSLMALVALAVASQVMAQVTFYEHDNFQGRSFTTERQVNDFGRNGFNDRASSAVVVGQRWEICENIRFGGRCVVLRPGRYASLDLMSLNDRVSSTRPVAGNAHVNDTRYAPVPLAPQIIFYEHEDFGGQTFTADQPVADLGRAGFNDRASSVVVIGERWEICTDSRFSGQCVVLQPGRYASLDVMGLNDRVSSTRPVARNARIDDTRHAPAPLAPEIVFYEHENFGGRTFTADQPVADLGRAGFNDRASSVVVIGERWEICTDSRFSGQCVVLQPGRYASLDVMGLNDRVSSVRPASQRARIDDERHAAPPVPAYDPRQSNNQRPYQANVISVHAVVGPPRQRCWVEREQVVQERGNVNAQPDQMQNFPRCAKVPPHARPEFWDVTYEFRGQQHRAHMMLPPGPTITVNQAGEPR